MNYLLSSLTVGQGHPSDHFSPHLSFCEPMRRGWARNQDFLMVLPAALLCGKRAKIRFLLQRRKSASHPRTLNSFTKVGIIARWRSLQLLCPLSLDCVRNSFHFGETLIWSWRCQLTISNDEKTERNQNTWVRLPYGDLSVFCDHRGVRACPGLTWPSCES